MNSNTAECLSEFVSSVRMLATKIGMDPRVSGEIEESCDSVVVTANTLIGVLQSDETII